MTVMLKRVLIAAVAVVAFSACSVDKTTAPGLTGPSALGLSLDVKASPDVLVRDGVSQSVIEVTVTDGLGRTVSGMGLFVTPPLSGQVTLGTIAVQSITTNSAGKASTTYMAPAAGVAATATITVTPVGSNFQQTVPRTISIRLLPPVSPGS